MSGRPISESDAAAVPGAEAAGWSAADVRWEALQESAADLAVRGDLDTAAPQWADALYLARQQFTPDDPRLATSLANRAHALRLKGDEAAAEAMFKEALLVWDRSGPWVEALRIERKARSSLYHLRMEARHWKTYEETAKKRLRRFAEEGRAAIVALASNEPADGNRGPSRWRSEKSPTFTDARKLHAAALLVVRLNEIGTA